MMKPDYDYQILRLTHLFYTDYPNPPHTELMKKDKRGYVCLLIQTHYDYYIAIPFRSNVSHYFSYHFKNSIRSKKCRSALDYTKICIIKNPDYIESKSTRVDKDEYLEVVHNIDDIAADAKKYVEDYVTQKEGKGILHEKEFERRYSRSTLKYFHNELGIIESS